MSTPITRFEDLKSWQHGRELARQIYLATNKGAFAKDYAMRDQIRRAVISITSNIAEGFERDGRQEFGQFLSVAKGSCGEVRSQTYLAEDQGYIETTEAENLRKLAAITSKLISGLMTYLRRTEYRGIKYTSSVREGADKPSNDAPLQLFAEELADYESESA